MAELLGRVEEARIEGSLEALISELESQGEAGPLNAVKIAHVRIHLDPDAAWAGLREVTVTPRGSAAAEYWAWLGMAEISLAWGILDQARINVEQALEVDADATPARALLGVAALRAGNLEEGASILREVFEREGAHQAAPAAAVVLARLELEAEETDKAREHLEAVVGHYPRRVEALEMLASVSVADDDFAAAVDYLERALDGSPGRADIADRLARLKQTGGDELGALAAWQRVSELRPDDVEAWRNQAELASGLLDNEAEERALEQISRLEPDSMTVLRRLAELRMESGRPAEARDAYSEILLREPEDRAALLARARLDIDSEYLRLAIGDLRMAAQVDEDLSEEDAAPAAEASELLAEVSEMVGLQSDSVTGRSPDAVYTAVSRVVNRAYRQRLQTLPALGGTYSIRVIVTGGEVVTADIVENSLHDPILEALIYWTIYDARFPPVDDPREFTLPFILNPG